MPVEAKGMVPGFCLASATSSLTDLMPSLGDTTSTSCTVGHQSDRREIAERVERHVRHDVRRHRHRAGGGEKQRVAVGIGFGDVAAAERAVGAGLVVDKDTLAEESGHLVGDDAADEIRRAAGRERHHDADRPAGKILRLGKLRRRQRQDRASADQLSLELCAQIPPVLGVRHRESGIRDRQQVLIAPIPDSR